MFGLKREIEQIAKDKGIAKGEIIRAVEEAMKQAARRDRGTDSEIEARYNDEIGEIELFEFREVVETLEDETLQVLVSEAQKFDPDAGCRSHARGPRRPPDSPEDPAVPDRHTRPRGSRSPSEGFP